MVADEHVEGKGYLRGSVSCPERRVFVDGATYVGDGAEQRAWKMLQAMSLALRGDIFVDHIAQSRL
jgi:hypothetical protein